MFQFQAELGFVNVSPPVVQLNSSHSGTLNFLNDHSKSTGIDIKGIVMLPIMANLLKMNTTLLFIHYQEFQIPTGKHSVLYYCKPKRRMLWILTHTTKKKKKRKYVYINEFWFSQNGPCSSALLSSLFYAFGLPLIYW